MKEKLEKSLDELLHDAFILGCYCCYSDMTPAGGFFTPRETKELTSDEWDWVAGHADGLIINYADRMKNGRCSWQAMIDFDVKDFESTIINDIDKMKKILARVGKPKRLTKEEMLKMGYVCN